MSETPRDSVDAIVDGWRAVRDDFDVSPIEVIARLGRLRAIVDRQIEVVLADHGLTAAGFSALAAIARLAGSDGVTQVRLMEELSLTSGTISVRIDRLVADGMVERHPDAVDRRGTRITLTPRGREAFENAAPAHLSNENRLLSALSADERRDLASLLRRLLVDLEDRPPADDGPARRLGITVASAHTTAAMRQAVGLPECAGLLVRAVRPGGPAARAGVVPGDVLTGVEGRHVRAIADLYEPPGTPAREVTTLQVARGQTRTEVRVAEGGPGPGE